MKKPLSKNGKDFTSCLQDRNKHRRFRISKINLVNGYFLPPAVALLLLSVAWYLWVEISNVPVYIMPSPIVVIKHLVQEIGFFALHGAITLFHATTGFSLGTIVAISAATIMIHSKFLERTIFPIAILIKVTPIVAIVPLLIIWFGFGSPPIVITAGLITFFPVLVNALTGLRSVNQGALDFFHSIHASKKEIFLKLRVPSSLPYLFAAFRISIPLSVIGAVVGELFGGSNGLGSVIFVAHHNLDMPTSFSAILILSMIGIILTMLPSYLESRLLFWHDSSISS